MTNTKVEDIRQLHYKLVQGSQKELFVELVWTHSDIVRQIAIIIMDNLENKGYIVDRDLVEEAALIHDIGMYHCFDDELNPDPSLPSYIMHGFIGEKLLLKEGFDPRLARFCSIHTATGFTKEDIERERLSVEVGDYIPISLEEEMLTYADKFHTKHPAFDDYETIANRISKFDPDRRVKLDTMRRKFGIPDISELKTKYANWSAQIDKQITAIVDAKN